MNRKVWVLEKGIDYEGSCLIRVYTSEEAAKKALLEIVENNKNIPSPWNKNYKLSEDGRTAHSERAGEEYYISEWEVEE